MANLLKFIRPFYISIIIALILAIIGSLFNIIGPRFIGYISTEMQEAIEQGRASLISNT